MKKHIILLLPVLAAALIIVFVLITVVGQKEKFNLAADDSVTIEEVDVTIPGLIEDCDLLYMSDLHIVVNDDYINPEDAENIENRKVSFTASNGKTSADNWADYCSCLNACHPDAVLFGGDMVDCATPSTLSLLKDGLDSLKQPYLYTRADHDLCPWWCDEKVSSEEALSLQEEIDGNEDVWDIQYPEFQVIGWNNSTSQMTEKQLQKMKELFETGKPVILVTHVPIEPLNDTSLAEASREAWGDRALLWGEDCFYEPDAVTQQFLDMLYSEDSPVLEILCGHLHLTWDGMVTEKIHEHVFSAAAYGNIGYIKVRSGE